MSGSSVNPPAMAHRQQMHLVLFDINRVDDSVVADTQTETIAAGKPIVRESGQARSHIINLCLNSCLDFRRKSEKSVVKCSIIDLGRGAHPARSRAAHSWTGAGSHFGLGLPNGGFKFRGKFHLVFDKIVKPISDLPQFCRG